MNHLFRFVLIATLCFLLVGCYETFSPIQSASVTQWQAGKQQGVAQPLTSEQIAKLSVWLQNHRWGWHSVNATYAPALLLLVTYSDGSRSSANLMPSVLVVGQHQRSLSEADSKALHSIIGVQNGN